MSLCGQRLTLLTFFPHVFIRIAAECQAQLNVEKQRGTNSFYTYQSEGLNPMYSMRKRARVPEWRGMYRVKGVKNHRM